MDREKVIKGIHNARRYLEDREWVDKSVSIHIDALNDALALLKEPEMIEPKTIPEELKQKMWNALYAKEDELEKEYIGTTEHDGWFLIYRSWLQKGFNLAIKAIADWEEGR